ncbi:MAG: TadE/TadG family type IV pilus assembly protein, partial [Terracidiphilus sp.]
MRLLKLLKRGNERAVMRAGAKRLKAESGQALVELAVSVPILALFVFGSIEIGNIIYSSISVTDAAMAAVQYGTRN